MDGPPVFPELMTEEELVRSLRSPHMGMGCQGRGATCPAAAEYPVP